VLKVRFRAIVMVAVMLLAVSAPASANMLISLTAGSTLSANTQAMAAFNRAISYWDSVFIDPIVVNISADFAALGSTVLGSATSSFGLAGYAAVTSAMQTDNSSSPSAAVTNALPGYSQFVASVNLPANVTVNNQISATRANLKALGLISGNDPTSDGSMLFSSDATFDFDNSDGVTAGAIDFQGVVSHEIGHVLGFTSVVDRLDTGTIGGVNINPLDLFRLGTSPADFTTAARELRPGEVAFFSDGTVGYGMSTGINLGDHRQAAHWKDDALTGNYIGVMDPTLATGFKPSVTYADLYAFDLIGYDLAVPEPGTFALMAAAAVLALFRRVCA
jgi:hypothetical protein